MTEEMTMTNTDQSSEHTSHNDIEELMIKAEEELETAKEQEELEQIINANINGFNEAIANTLKEIMDGDTSGTR